MNKEVGPVVGMAMSAAVLIAVGLWTTRPVAVAPALQQPPHVSSCQVVTLEDVEVMVVCTAPKACVYISANGTATHTRWYSDTCWEGK